MPYIKQNIPHEKTRRLLKGYDITANRLSSILLCSLPTARKKLNNPGLLSGDDWLKISRRGHIPLEEIRVVILS